ncbi:BCCT family transporter [Streptomyces sp. HNM0575]|uniref:BCCT family transporter n=1 Tax=Streptomyces sp. HNM0575 TaxID=2716338 RepID=UPI00145F7982|nr:BCCT family transporter [Streptomyces sp. HNM0575]NLU72724.1 BCCT family transporter [Streptomyces sp. HNM0575]
MSGGKLEAGVARDLEPAVEGQASERRTDRVVFGIAVLLALAFVVWGAVATDSLVSVSTAMLISTMHNGGWAFVLAAPGCVVFSLGLAFSRYGEITLGKEGEQPEFRTVSWVAMMFSAGMGLTLLFYGVSEPLAHFTDPPPGTPAGGSAAERMQTAMSTTLFHWTLYPWAIFAVVGLAIAYSCFRRGRRQTISAVFTPLVGEKNANGAFGRVIDILALLATLFGTASSLGRGALQISSGVKEVGWAGSVGTLTLAAVTAGLAIPCVAYAASGVQRGFQRLSNMNMVLATSLAVFVFVEGPTVLTLNLLPTSVSSFVGDLPQLAARTESTAGKGVAEWLSSWTVFYWAWWISWTPFVGMFIARISRGRTIRQFVGGVILVPSVVSLIWFAAFGGTAISLERSGAGISEVSTVENQLFAVLREYPLVGATMLMALILMATFFVSGADAASRVMGTLSQRGALEPSRNVVVVWGLLLGALAMVMLLIGGGGAEAIDGLKTLAVLVAVPFTLVMIGMCAAVLRDLRGDPLTLLGDRRTKAVEAAVTAGDDQYGGEFAIRIRPSDASTPHGGNDLEAPARLPGSRGPCPAPVADRKRTAGRDGKDRGA